MKLNNKDLHRAFHFKYNQKWGTLSKNYSNHIKYMYFVPDWASDREDILKAALLRDFDET